MKIKLNCMLALCLALGSSAWADDLSQGRIYLSQSNYVAADKSFSNAVARAPQDPVANVLRAATRFLAFPNQPAGSNFLTRIAVSKTGRVLDNWTAGILTNSQGNPAFVSGLNFKEAGEMLRKSLLPEIIAAEANLAVVTNQDFLLTLTKEETHGVAVTLDYGDILLLRTFLQAAEFFCYTTASLNFDAQVSTVMSLAQNDQLSLERLLKDYPKALTYATTSDLGLARTAFQSGIDQYMQASQFIRNRSTNVTRLFNYDLGMSGDEENFRQMLAELKSSLIAPVALSADTNFTVSLASLFDGTHPIRSFLPTFTGDAFIMGSLPDPTFGGLITGFGKDDIEEALMNQMGAVMRQPGVKLSEVSAFAQGGSRTLMQASDGNLYGTDAYGGPEYCGLIFKVTTTGVRSTLHSFTSSGGTYPLGTLAEGPDGALYGTTLFGGDNGDGTVFKITRTGTVTKLASFSRQRTGANPDSGLILGRDGNFYGVTSNGGETGDWWGGNGTIYRLTPSGELTCLLVFDSSIGGQPNKLVQGADGDLYGTTKYGGNFGLGRAFRVTTQGHLVWTAQLGSSANGGYASVSGPLVQVSDGSFYGTVNGWQDNSSIIKITPDGGVASIISLSKKTGYAPENGLIKGNDGSLYAATSSGGGKDCGAIFKLGAGDVLSPLAWFEGENGDYPSGPLIQAPDGSFYGTTQNGGSQGGGNVYRLTISPAPVSIVSAPQNQNLAAGANLRLSVTVSGTEPLTYQWFMNNQPLPGQAGPVLEINNVQAIHAGTYKVTIANRLNSVSATCTVAVLSAPVITKQPVSQEVVSGGNSLFTVSATGSLPMSYQWFRNQTPIAKATNASLTQTKVTPLQAGVYTVSVQNPLNSLMSSEAVLKVIPPAPLITTPSGKYYTNPVVKGTAVAGVTQVLVSLNGGDFQPATGTTSWSMANLPFVAGSNTVAVKVLCGDSASPVASRSYFVISTTQLALSITGKGSLKPGLVNGQTLLVGNAYSVTAIPAPGYVFSSWGGSAANPPFQIPTPLNGIPPGMEPKAEPSTTLRFLAPSNATLAVTFVTNPFVAVQGSYNGLFLCGSNPALSGSFTMKLTATASFTGKLLTDGGPYSITGQFGEQGIATVVVSRKNRLTLTARFQLVPEEQKLVGFVTDGVSYASLKADRYAFTMTNKATAFAGNYTFIAEQAEGMPNGTGCGTISVDSLGNVQFAGNLSDDAAVVQRSPLALNGAYPLYVSLYNGKGAVFGWVNLTNGTMVQGELTWMSATNPAGKVYRNGFTNHVTILGSRYTYTKGTRAIQGTNFLASLTGGNLSATITNSVALNTNNVFTVVPPIAAKLSLKLTPATGAISGSFTHPGSRKNVVIRGVIMQEWNSGVGFFLGTNQTGSFLLDQPF